MQIPDGLFGYYHVDTEKNSPEAIKAVAKEMEALFAYEMIKAMRQASGSGVFGKGLGADTYGSIFDMEIARVLAEKGLGFQDVIAKELARMKEKTEE
jgi:flagellar protein FlgJ